MERGWGDGASDWNDRWGGGTGVRMTQRAQGWSMTERELVAAL